MNKKSTNKVDRFMGRLEEFDAGEQPQQHPNHSLLMTEQKPKIRHKELSESFFEKLSENRGDLIVPTIASREAEAEKLAEATDPSQMHSPNFLGDPFQERAQHDVFTVNPGLLDSQISNPDLETKATHFEQNRDLNFTKDNSDGPEILECSAVLKAKEPHKPPKSTDRQPPAATLSESLSGASVEQPSRKRLLTASFNSLYQFLQQIFTNKLQLSLRHEISPGHEQVLQAFFRRKFKRTVPLRTANGRWLPKLDEIAEVLNTNSLKRPEECYKFMLIRAMKFLKDKLAKAQNVNHISDENFYAYYFGEVATTQKIDIYEFYYPFMKKAKKNAKLNCQYYQKLRLSERFVADCKIYMNSYFEQDQQKEISKKIVSLLRPFDRKLNRGEATETCAFGLLVEYILNHRHCKFPWLPAEAKECLNRFYKQLNTKSGSI